MSTLASSNPLTPAAVAVEWEEPYDPALSIHKRRRKLSLEEFMDLPDDGIERRLRYGYLIEGDDVSRRSRIHAACTAAITGVLFIWKREHPEHGGEVANGDADFMLSREKSLTVGIDVAYVSAETASKRSEDTTMYDGPPLLAIEVHSPSDKQGDVLEKVDDYLRHGTQLVWYVEPRLKTVMVHRPNALPALFTIDDEISAEPHLPGFKVKVRELLGE